MRSTLKRSLLKGLAVARADRCLQLVNRRRVTIVTYHGFTDATGHDGIENNHGKHLKIDVFRSHLEYLKRCYHVISLDRLIEHYRAGTPVPDRSAVITIDDGYRSTFTLAYPLLKEYGLPATVFLVTGFIDNKEWLWTDRLEYALSTTTVARLSLTIGADAVQFDLVNNRAKVRCDGDLRSRLKLLPQEDLAATIAEIELRLGCKPATGDAVPDLYRPLAWTEIGEMNRGGLMSFGSHTDTHVILSRCAPDRARAEVTRSRQIIEERTGVPCTLFCYPNGRPGCFNAFTGSLLRETGYTCALTTVTGMNDERSDTFELKRMPVEDHGDLDRFILTVSGVVDHLDRFQRSIRGVRPSA